MTMAGAARKKADASDDTVSYGELRRQLDEVMQKLQDPECDVDEAVGLYEQALGHINRLEEFLQSAENKVEKVHADFSAGVAGE